MNINHLGYIAISHKSKVTFIWKKVKLIVKDPGFLVSFKYLCTFHYILEITHDEQRGGVTVSKQENSASWTESDSRPSAIATGTVVGLLCCVIPILAIIILDLPVMRSHLLRMAYNINGDEKYNRKRETRKSRSKNSRDEKQSEKRRERRGRDALGTVVLVTEQSEV